MQPGPRGLGARGGEADRSGPVNTSCGIRDRDLPRRWPPARGAAVAAAAEKLNGAGTGPPRLSRPLRACGARRWRGPRGGGRAPPPAPPGKCTARPGARPPSRRPRAFRPCGGVKRVREGPGRAARSARGRGDGETRLERSAARFLEATPRLGPAARRGAKSRDCRRRHRRRRQARRGKAAAAPRASRGAPPQPELGAGMPSPPPPTPAFPRASTRPARAPAPTLLSQAQRPHGGLPGTAGSCLRASGAPARRDRSRRPVAPPGLRRLCLRRRPAQILCRGRWTHHPDSWLPGTTSDRPVGVPRKRVPGATSYEPSLGNRAAQLPKPWGAQAWDLGWRCQAPGLG